MKAKTPKSFRFAHRFCRDLAEIIEAIVTDGEAEGAFDVEIPLAPEERAEVLATLDGEALVAWLIDRGYRERWEEIAYKNVLHGLLADMSSFLYEALSCLERRQLTAAFCLFRKPFKENLFYLEWMLADRNSFLKAFLSDSAVNVDITRNFGSKEAKRKIIKSAAKKTWWSIWLGDDLLYDLRYEKSASYGMEWLWNQATHLITTRKEYETDEENFNFIFSTQDDWHEQLEHIYFQIPILLMHAVDVAETLLQELGIIDENESDWRRTRRVVGFGLWADQTHTVDLTKTCLHRLWSDLRLTSKISCSECDHEICLGIRDAVRFYMKGTVRCAHCGAQSMLENDGVTVGGESRQENDEFDRTLQA